MTKLVHWLSVGVLFLAVWGCLVAELLPIRLSSQLHEALTPLPVYLLICFGCYSLATIGYRLMTFNDCTSAASELMEDIANAKEDLERRGIKL